MRESEAYAGAGACPKTKANMSYAASSWDFQYANRRDLHFSIGTLAIGTTVAPLSSLERVEKINSIYLQKGKIRLGYGLFIINDRIVGVRASRWYLLTSIIHAPMVMLGSFWGLLLLFLGLGGQFGVVFFVPVIVEVVWAAVNSILVLPAMERVLRGKDYSIDELEEKKDFEARRTELWELEIRQPNGLSPGMVEFRLQSRDTFRIRMLWTRGRTKRFAEMFRLVETFTARQPFYNYKGWAIWRLD